MATPVLGEEDREAIADLAMWRQKLKALSNIEVVERWLGLPAGAVPAHSEAFFFNLASYSVRWRATDGSDVGGAVALTRGPFQKSDPGYGFGADEHFMIVDRHNDQAMAFLRHRDGESVDAAAVVGAMAGEEGDARWIAGSMGAYVKKAVEARFGNYWFVRDAQAAAARAFVDAQPLDPTPRFEVTVTSVGAPDPAALRVLALSFLPAKIRGRIGAAAGEKSEDPAAIAAAIEAALAGKPAALKTLGQKIGKALSTSAGEWQPRLFFGALDPELRFVHLRTKRLGASFIATNQPMVYLHAAQLLLDAPGAEALARAVNVDHVRFCPLRGFSEAQKVVTAFANEPDKALPGGAVLGEVEIAILIPASLLPTGLAEGVKYSSIAPAADGTLGPGKVMKSV